MFTSHGRTDHIKIQERERGGEKERGDEGGVASRRLQTGLQSSILGERFRKSESPDPLLKAEGCGRRFGRF